jgi:hypothetical protein
MEPTMKNYILSLALAVAALALGASPANAVTIQGASFITPTTGIAPCAVSICLGFGTDINQISDGDTANFNGYAGADGVVGIITLDLLGNFDLQSFTLWNDINVVHEGVETFKLHFYDASDTFIQSTATLSAPVGQTPGQTYSFASSVLNVSKVDLETLTLLSSVHGSRIEIREVAFDGAQSVSGSPVPEPGTILLLGSGLASLAAWRRKRTA